MKKLSKTEAEKEIADFFKDAENKSTKDVKKIKKLAMSHNIPLKELRKKFCKKCYSPIKGKIRIKEGKKIIICEKCGGVMRWKLK
jgi:RNase P subunit RPR2